MNNKFLKLIKECQKISKISSRTLRQRAAMAWEPLTKVYNRELPESLFSSLTPELRLSKLE
jgi:hypothetical protein